MVLPGEKQRILTFWIFPIKFFIFCPVLMHKKWMDLSFLLDAKIVPSGEKQKQEKFLFWISNILSYSLCTVRFFQLQLNKIAPFKFIPLISTLSNSEPLKFERTKFAPNKIVSLILMFSKFWSHKSALSSTSKFNELEPHYMNLLSMAVRWTRNLRNSIIFSSYYEAIWAISSFLISSNSFNVRFFW